MKQNKTLLLVGANSFLGIETVLVFLEKGYNVIGTYNNKKDKLDELHRSLPDQSKLTIHQLDVRSSSSVISLVDDIFATNKITTVVYASGLMTARNSIESFDDNKIEDLMSVNFFGFLYLIRALAKYKSKSSLESIVAISSEAGTTGGNMIAPYAASKAALNAFIKGVSRELGTYQIRVNAVSPHIISTPDNPGNDHSIKLISLKRSGKPIEVANTILWLCSKSASYINGCIIPITGGR